MPVDTELTPEVRERRIAVAKDFLAITDPDRPAAESAVRLARGYGYFTADLGRYVRIGVELQPLLPASKCTVCAIGALFLCHVRLFDRHTTDEAGITQYRTRGEIVDALAETFDPHQLDLIEAAFEGTTIHACADWPAEDYPILQAAAGFAEALDLDPYVDDDEQAEKLARAIMQNVIANGGVFTVEPVAEDHDGEATP